MIKPLILLFTVLFSFQSNADILMLDKINKLQPFEIPSRGMSMDQVIVKFGEPIIKKDSIGKPPITKWQYNGFSVYFEKTWVINSVIHKASAD